MPNWNSVLREISVIQQAGASAHDKVRRKYLKRLYNHTGRNVIAYYSGFLTKPRIEGIEINDDDKNGFMLAIHEMKRDGVGLDLILHTPGGDGQATISLVEYLRDMFGNDIRAIIPQIAMSAGTMISCSCKSIIMGKESSIGPIDPQFGSIAAANLLEEVKKARDDIITNPNLALFWNPILSKITPSFIERCEWALKDSNEFINVTLRKNMFARLTPQAQDAAIEKISKLLANNEGRAHNTHIQYQECVDAGLVVERLEDDPILQDLVLTIHHCYMHTLANTSAFKIVENHMGRAMVRIQQMAAMQVPVSLASGGPA